MKEILLDLVEVTRAEISDVDDQLVDFGVVGPGPRRALNWLNGRRWFDNDQDSSPGAERMYIEELKQFRAYMVRHTDVEALQNLNLLGPCLIDISARRILCICFSSDAMSQLQVCSSRCARGRSTSSF